MIDCTVLENGDWVLYYQCDRYARHNLHWETKPPETYLLVRKGHKAVAAPEGWEWLTNGGEAGGEILCPDCVQARLKDLYDTRKKEKKE